MSALKIAACAAVLAALCVPAAACDYNMQQGAGLAETPVAAAPAAPAPVAAAEPAPATSAAATQTAETAATTQPPQPKVN